MIIAFNLMKASNSFDFRQKKCRKVVSTKNIKLWWAKRTWLTFMVMFLKPFEFVKKWLPMVRSNSFLFRSDFFFDLSSQCCRTLSNHRTNLRRSKWSWQSLRSTLPTALSLDNSSFRWISLLLIVNVRKIYGFEFSVNVNNVNRKI